VSENIPTDPEWMPFPPDGEPSAIEVFAIGVWLWQKIAEGPNGEMCLKPLNMRLIDPVDYHYDEQFEGILKVAPEIVAQAFQRDAGLEVLLLKREHRAE
jgi:hypothetical protein